MNNSMNPETPIPPAGQQMAVPVQVPQNQLPATSPSASSVPARRPKKKRIRIEPVETLGLSKRRWSELSQKAIAEFGEYIDKKITRNTLLVGGFESIEHVEFAISEARKMLVDPDLSPEQRVKVLGMIALIGKSWTEMAKQVQSLAGGNLQELSSEDQKPRNLPPSIPLTINVGPAPAPQPYPANSGTPSPVIDISR